MIYFITPLIYNDQCRWYDNSSKNVAVYQLYNSRDWIYVENISNSSNVIKLK